MELCSNPWILGTGATIFIISILAVIGARLSKKEEVVDKCKNLVESELYTRAIEYCESVAEKYKEPTIYRCLGRAYLQIGEIDRAIESFKKVEELSKGLKRIFNIYIIKKAEFYEEFADILREANRIDEAIEYYKKVLENQKKEQENGRYSAIPKIITLLQKIAELYEEKGDLDEAINYYEELIVILNILKKPSTIMIVDQVDQIYQNVARKLVKLYEKKGNMLMVNKMREKIKEEIIIEEKAEKEEEEKRKEETRKKEKTITKASTTLTKTKSNPII
jgi:tetratricopeptide (TPR) repeat protein